MIFVAWLMYIHVQFFSSAANSTTDLHGVTQPVACRTERRMYLLYDQYKADTCARCYNYMPTSAFKVKYRYHSWMGILRDPVTNKTYEADPLNTSQGLLDSFSDESFVVKWNTCCIAAIECCDRMIQTPPPDGNQLYCPRTWDGWHCWDDTLAGTTAKQPCQSHIYFQTNPPSCTKYSYKVCWPNGTWYLNGNLREWTNYSKCGRVDEYRRFLYFHIGTYTISVVSMVPALIIFSIYKQLQVHRITMHKNLFLSLFLNGIVVLLFKSIVILDEFNRSSTYETIMQKNGGLCKFLFILTKYFRMTNYMWMFCEGFYLHKLIAAAFAEQKNLIMFYIIGWVLPIIPASIYATLRKTMDDEKCWAFPAEYFEWIMNAPNMLSLLVNFFFLCDIIRVLVTKLRATHSNEPSQYRKAVRATLILVPLFGLQFFLVIYRPQSGHCGLLEAYTYFSHAIDGLQGFMVSLIFCYMNGEDVFTANTISISSQVSLNIQPTSPISFRCPYDNQGVIQISNENVLYLVKRSYQRYRLSHHFQSQNSIMLNPVSVTQVSTMGESHTTCQQGLHYRTKTADRQGDAIPYASNSGNFQENTTTV